MSETKRSSSRLPRAFWSTAIAEPKLKQAVLAEMQRCCTPSQQRLLRAIYGFDGPPQKVSDAARRFGMTTGSARQISLMGELRLAHRSAIARAFVPLDAWRVIQLLSKELNWAHGKLKDAIADRQKAMTFAKETRQRAERALKASKRSVLV